MSEPVFDVLEAEHQCHTLQQDPPHLEKEIEILILLHMIRNWLKEIVNLW